MRPVCCGWRAFILFSAISRQAKTSKLSLVFWLNEIVLFSAISHQAKTSKPVSLLGTQGYAGKDTKKHSPPRTCAARGGLSVEKRGKKPGGRTTGHLRAGSKCSLQTDTHLFTDWVITQNTQSIYTLLQGCGWLAQGTKMSVKPKDKTYRSSGLRPPVLHVARLTCILLYERGR